MNSEELTVEQLKADLRKGGAKLSGRKRDLYERLEAYKRNDNFGQSFEVATEYNMELPDITAYKDVNSNSLLPPFPFKRIQTYLYPLGKLFGEKPRDLYDGNFLKFVRFNTSNGTSFLCTVCKAEKKKGLTYIVDISIDKYSCVLQCQCECGAGMGPEAHCKHVCVLLYVVYQFYLGKPLKTEETCTQKLQTFNKTKNIAASPLKSFDLNLTGKDTSNFRYDPREQDFINDNSSNRRLENVAKNKLNFGHLPVSDLFKPSHIPSVAHDHDYLTKYNEDCFLDQVMVTTITE